MGASAVKRVLINPEAVPTKFSCQERDLRAAGRPLGVLRERQTIVSTILGSCTGSDSTPKVNDYASTADSDDNPMMPSTSSGKIFFFMFTYMK